MLCSLMWLVATLWTVQLQRMNQRDCNASKEPRLEATAEAEISTAWIRIVTIEMAESEWI